MWWDHFNVSWLNPTACTDIWELKSRYENSGVSIKFCWAASLQVCNASGFSSCQPTNAASDGCSSLLIDYCTVGLGPFQEPPRQSRFDQERKPHVTGYVSVHVKSNSQNAHTLTHNPAWLCQIIHTYQGWNTLWSFPKADISPLFVTLLFDMCNVTGAASHAQKNQYMMTYILDTYAHYSQCMYVAHFAAYSMWQVV